MFSSNRLSIFLIALFFATVSSLAVVQEATSAGKNQGKQGGGKNTSLSTVKPRDWNESYVRRVLAAFAYGGLATDAQIKTWATMKPLQAVTEILTFESVNAKLSPPEAGDDSHLHCGSLESLQDFWSSNEPGNRMRFDDRYRYATLNNNTSPSLSTSHLQRTWSKAISTRGCNPFLHKIGLYLTNYHASISVHKTRAGLIRDYYDRILQALTSGADFVQVMTIAASHAAVARAYGHQYSTYNNNNDTFSGTDDFGREFHQLFFRIQGTTEDEIYHEDTTIEHTAWLLSGMNLDKQENAYGSTSSGDWYVAPIVFTDHYDTHSTPRLIKNFTNHYHSELGSGSCLEILHQDICGATADAKIAALASVAATHTESMENVPIYMIDFFADDNLDADKTAAIRSAWAEANFDILTFLRDYASSTQFHRSATFKYKTAFDRNLSIANANTLTNEAVFGRNYYDSPYYPMRNQGVEVFEPVHDVFGGQTGFQAANNRYIFKEAYWNNAENPNFLYDLDDTYTLDGVTELVWTQDWGSLIPVNDNGQHLVSEVATWLWNRFIADGGNNFDPIARAQIQALLATRRDFGYTVDSVNPEIVYSSADITTGVAQTTNQANAATLMNLLSENSNDRREANLRVGMAVNFITMTPFSFAMEGQ